MQHKYWQNKRVKEKQTFEQKKFYVLNGWNGCYFPNKFFLVEEIFEVANKQPVKKKKRVKKWQINMLILVHL